MRLPKLLHRVIAGFRLPSRAAHGRRPPFAECRTHLPQNRARARFLRRAMEGHRVAPVEVFKVLVFHKFPHQAAAFRRLTGSTMAKSFRPAAVRRMGPASPLRLTFTRSSPPNCLRASRMKRGSKPKGISFFPSISTAVEHRSMAFSKAILPPQNRAGDLFLGRKPSR